jgi:predicted PurR-regulated permease PerM
LNESTRWTQPTRFMILGAMVILLVWLLLVAMPLVEALIISGLLAYLLDPLVRLVMRRLRLGRGKAAALIFTLLLLLALALPATFGALAYERINQWSIDLGQVAQAAREWLSQPLVIFGFTILPRSYLQDLGQAAGSALTNLPGGSFNILSSLTTNLLWGLAIVVSFYYFLKDGPKIKPWLVEIAPPAYRLELTHLLDEIDQLWSLFMRAQILIFIILASLMGLGAWLAILLFRAGWLPFSTIGLIITLVVIYALVSQVDNIWLRPQLFGHHLHLHPALVFIGLIGALALGGILAAVLVVPVMASLKVLGRYVRCKLYDLPLWFEGIDEPENLVTPSMNETGSNPDS